MAVKDWLSLTFSFVALLVSVATALFNVILLQDIRVFIGNHPNITSDGGQLVISGDQELTFINSGNRTAAVTFIGGIAWKLKGSQDDDDDKGSQDDDEDCHGRPIFSALPILFDAKPFVLKAGEISVVSAGLKEGAWKRSADGTFRLSKEIFEAKPGDVYLACLNLDIVTPDNYSERLSLPVYKFTMSSEGVWGFEVEELFDKEEPIFFLGRTSTIFAKYWR